MLEALSNSSFSQWVTVSRWAYPMLLTLHGLGMGVVVGLLVMVGLRVMGFPKQIPLAAYAQTLPLGIGAFIVNFVSGTTLFVADAAQLARNPSFIIKIIAIIIGLIIFTLFYRGPIKKSVFLHDRGQAEYVPTTYDKTLAVLTIFLWAGAVILSGRLIAYLSDEGMS